MTQISALRAWGFYLSLAVPLAASCAREDSAIDPSLGLGNGGSKNTAGSKGNVAGTGTSGSSVVAGTTGNAFGGTSAQGGKPSGDAGTTSSPPEGGDGNTTAGTANGGSGGSGGGNGVPPDVLARASVIVYYETSHTTASDKTIQLKLHIKNQSPDPLPMAHVSIKYWCTAEVAPTLHQYYTGPQAQLPEAEYVSAGADSYALMTFGGGSIVKDGDLNASEIQLELASNSTAFDQSDDFSWDPSATTSKPNAKITLYLDDELIWGCEPSGKCFDDAGGEGGAAGVGGAGSAGESGSGGTSTGGPGGAGGDSAAGQGGAP